MNVKIKKVHPNAVIPAYAKPGDSGFDLLSIDTNFIMPGETKLIQTGLAFELPEGYELQIRPRSGFTLHSKLRVQFGTVDSGYRGEIGIIVDNIGDEKDLIPMGMRIAQGVIAPVVRANLVETDDLTSTERGTGGFGSTGY